MLNTYTMPKVLLILFICIAFTGIVGFSAEAGGIYAVSRLVFYCCCVLFVMAFILGLLKSR